jgi:hypothetical protein
MNDKELDELLDTWVVPPVPDSLRQNVEARFAAQIERKRLWRVIPRSRKGVFLFAFGLAVFFLIVSQALPQAPRLELSLLARPPFTVDSEFISYHPDGSATVDEYATSFTEDGDEVLVAESMPERPFATAAHQVSDVLGLMLFEVSKPFRDEARKERVARFAKKGCIGPTVVGRDTVLGYDTAIHVLKLGLSKRFTIWRAPDLNCFALRVTTEERLADGTLRLTNERRALSVNVRKNYQSAGR